MSFRFIYFVLPFGCLAGCAHQTPGAEPHDMSAAQHEAMARQEQSTAEAHSARYQATSEGTQCGRAEPCWTTTRNPTQEHLNHAAEHKKRAADHRAASQALRDAEARSCVGISEEDRATSPFDHREDIESVEKLFSPPSGGKHSMSRFEGATVTFRAVPAMSAQWLQRLVDCHLARNAALGHEVPEMAYCPLVHNGVTASVTQTSAGFAVGIRGADTATADEIWRRVQTLGRLRSE